jgi:hypothetical protein
VEVKHSEHTNPYIPLTVHLVHPVGQVIQPLSSWAWLARHLPAELQPKYESHVHPDVQGKHVCPVQKESYYNKCDIMVLHEVHWAEVYRSAVTSTASVSNANTV